MRIAIASCLFAVGFGLTSSLPAIASDAEFQWRPENGEALDFKVLRNGNEFGYHTVEFSVENDQIEVTNDIELKVSMGPLRLFYYRHESEEVWKDGQLHTMNGETRKDGDTLTMTVQKAEDALKVSGSGFDGEVSPMIIPSSHWNIQQVKSDKILSSENGEILEVSVEDLGQEEIQTENGTILANRFRMVSDLTVDLWYDESGRWVKCAFVARDQNIEYVLKS